MNTPTAAPMREDVTQADVKAAAAIMEWLLTECEPSQMPTGADNPLVQAFARHRLAHTARPDAGDEEALIERGVRAAYDDWPHTVISDALAAATGLPHGATIDYDTSVRLGMDASGLRRTVRAALLATCFAPIARPDVGDEDVERPMTEQEFGSQLSTALVTAYRREGGIAPIARAGGAARIRNIATLEAAAVYRAAIAAMPKGVDRGMVEVPREPTIHMLAAGIEEWSQHDDCERDVLGIWNAMIAAVFDKDRPR